MKKIVSAVALLSALGLATAVEVSAREYRFHVACPDKQLVMEWGIGDIDPGREYLRVVTGTKFPGCSIGGYDASLHGALPKERESDASAVIQGVPLIGPILKSIFG